VVDTEKRIWRGEDVAAEITPLCCSEMSILSESWRSRPAGALEVFIVPVLVTFAYLGKSLQCGRALERIGRAGDVITRKERIPCYELLLKKQVSGSPGKLYLASSLP